MAFQSVGYLIFELECHLPYFALRTSRPPEVSSQRGVKTKPPRKWTDLSFLEMRTPKSQYKRMHGIYEAQISFVICGSDDWQWVAYAFIDVNFDGDDLEDEVFSYEEFQKDPIALGEHDANLPIMNPRMYFFCTPNCLDCFSQQRLYMHRELLSRIMMANYAYDLENLLPSEDLISGLRMRFLSGEHVLECI